MNSENIKPYTENLSKKEQIRTMFNRIAFRYDFLNRFLSFGVDVAWRGRVVKMVCEDKPRKILDIATGTGDLAIMLARANASTDIVGVDLSPDMLNIARSKVSKRKLHNISDIREADAEILPFSNNSFDVITVAFGVRNFENISLGLQQMFRVLNSGGVLYVLEFSMPDNKIFGAFYTFYFRRLLPFIGGVFSGETKAYRYLQQSVEAFDYGDKFVEKLKEQGFKNISQTKLTVGLAIIYRAEKN